MQTADRKYRRSVKANYSLIIILVVFTICNLQSVICNSQIIVPPTIGISPSEPAFSKTFIKQNKIKTISASVVDKPDGEIIRDKGLAQVYVFDTSGNLTRNYFNEVTSIEKTETEIPAVVKRGRVVKKAHTKTDFQYQYDTLGTEFFYSSTGYLIMKRVCIGDFYNSTYYEYFGDGLISRQTVCKETNIAKRGEKFKLGVQTVISEEKFQYEQLTPTQVKKKFLNDEGKPYKQGILNFINGKPLDESYQFEVGFIRSAVNYKYDSQSRLTEKIMTDNSSGDNMEKITYEYDEAGNLKTEKRFKNGTQTNEIIYFYEAPASLLATGSGRSLLTSQANRQIQQASIKIIKYEYSFY